MHGSARKQEFTISRVLARRWLGAAVVNDRLVDMLAVLCGVKFSPTPFRPRPAETLVAASVGHGLAPKRVPIA